MGKPYRPKDHYFQRAKQRGFRARSAFKLEELVQRFGLVRPGARVLDLGAAPVDATPKVQRERRRPRWSRHGKGASPQPDVRRAPPALADGPGAPPDEDAP